ncbi:Alpha/beta hydrolase fold-1 domain-containing protein [Operophtera brumata]|uniref:Alpha/beta hydrolase fold-1 domain-containing protein n=1 Tax=Operophtera brumata TaxID=104452 RepID=A0A0L7LIE3_OPEBR|nr:Alpha/beta hydrolase fold-1 domain-containing protein [Operophtera brumata]
MAVCVMVKLATEITVEERRRDLMLLNDGGGGDRFQLKGSMGVISLDNTEAANRVAARYSNKAANRVAARYSNNKALIAWLRSARYSNTKAANRVAARYSNEAANRVATRYSNETANRVAARYSNEAANRVAARYSNEAANRVAARYSNTEAANRVAARYSNTEAANRVAARYSNTEAANRVAARYSNTEAANRVAARYSNTKAANRVAARYTNTKAANRVAARYTNTKAANREAARYTNTKAANRVAARYTNTKAANRVAARYSNTKAANRVAASWSFACFASLILVKWVVTSAHCRSSNSTHRVLLYYDYTKHYSETYAVLFWRLHEQYNISKPSHKYDIAVAKINMENRNSLAPKAAVFDSQRVTDIEASLWKTVMSIDRKIYLTNDFHMYKLKIESSGKCFQSYGVEISEDLICIDLSEHDEMCFVHEFGPIYNQDKVVGVLAVKPAACDTKVAVFTNVSYYSNWITKSTLTTYYG